MHFYTYKITNLLNGKFYIGVHKTENLNDGYMGSGKVLKRSIAKNGIENFKKDILMFHESEDEMFEMEALIVDQEFVDRKDTYNLKLGGHGGWDHITLSKEERVKLSSLGGNGLAQKRTNHIIDVQYRFNVSQSIKLAWANGKYDGKMDHLSTLWIGRNHKPETIEKVKNTFAEIKHQQGEKNSQFGKMWIHSLELRKSTRINKDEPIPEGWNKGRKMFKE
ncbi:putative GIY-YIG family Seg-like homing endonuclease [Acinetobacter phage AbTZA1]|uniref:Putative GIY-YIG family Seg-like homing endonuclease n=1 Tax=Acinetobacter phage AbTZA1 TaxID=2500827 RepID=A0A3Q9R706_9CAUD|nr:homing endonuclease [Acinetobacter phage AbTZA1]AZU98596.1 putative GIY-YIG family Seg-like homing endonuclease [Acinetobacter phage AbTZA1]